MSGKRLSKDRAWELDFLRGIAILMMVFMHMSWDVRYEFGVDTFTYLYQGWFWSFIHPVIVVLFVSISGVCCTLSRNNVKRGLKLLAATVVMYATTFIIYKVTGIECLILFNVLAVLTCGIFLYALIAFLENKTKANPNVTNLIMGLAGLYIVIVGCNIHYMVFLIGCVIGRTCYKDKKTLFAGKGKVMTSVARPVEFIGRHSLIIYLVHQPVIYALLYVIFLLVRR